MALGVLSKALLTCCRVSSGSPFVYSSSRLSYPKKSYYRYLSKGFPLKSKEMENEGVIPDVIDTVPENVIEVKYGSNVVNLGNELTPTDVKDLPTHINYPADESGLYLLCMTDPDAPSRQNPKYREWHHWLVGNIPGTDVSKGETLSEYIGSGPPKGTGLHRYVFLVYKQPGHVKFHEKHLTNRSGDHRGCFKIRDFAKKYDLGQPIAGNFYKAQWDDYVPKLYEQLAQGD